MNKITITLPARTSVAAGTTHGILEVENSRHNINLDIDVFAYQPYREVVVNDLLRRIKKGLRLVALIEEVP